MSNKLPPILPNSFIANALLRRDQPAALTRMPMPPANGPALGLPPIPGRVRKAQSIDPQLLKIRLNQILYDKRLASQAGIDVNGPDWVSTNVEIRNLREMLKGK